MENLFENKRWLVIPTSITGSINWNQVQESSPTSLRFSLDGTKTFVKYQVNEVTTSFIQSIWNPETRETQSYTVEAGVYGRPSIYSPDYQECTHPEILAILSTEEWTRPMTGSVTI